jgi:excisionase family DNA binding protein
MQSSIESSGESALLRVGPAAKFLGVSRDVLDGLALRGEVPYYLIGSRHKRFKPEDLAAYREANRRPARP